MARQRTTFGKIMREREKQQRAQAKQEKRAERAAEVEGDEETVEEIPTHDQDDVLASLAKLHEAYDAEQIDFDTFEERRAELMSRLKID
jgi:hypothetical protein